MQPSELRSRVEQKRIKVFIHPLRAGRLPHGSVPWSVLETFHATVLLFLLAGVHPYKELSLSAQAYGMAPYRHQEPQH